MRRHFALILVTSLLLCLRPNSSLSAQEIAPLSSAELHDLCLGYAEYTGSPDSRSCAAYIRFIDGSPQVHVRTEAANPRRESFRERAYRTRVGTQRPPEPVYCLDRSVSVQQFVAQLLTYLGDRSVDEAASTALYGTLRRFYRCGPSG
jgi:hypothetical protein